MSSLPRQPRYDSLDFWRGIACLSVALYHSVLLRQSLTNGGGSGPIEAVLTLLGQLWIGVPLFFVISGYCIAAAADNHRLRGKKLTDYFWRRFRRIYPPLWIVIACSIAFFVFDFWPLGHLLSDPPWEQLRPWWYSGWQWVGNLTLTETWRVHVIGPGRAHFPGQAWTLCYEEQFYAVMGLLLLAPKYIFRGAVAITVLTALAVAAAQSQSLDISGFFFDGNWFMFAAGIGVYHTTNYGQAPARLWLSLVLIVGVFTAALVPVSGVRSALVFALIVLWLRPLDRQLVAAPLARPIFYCGRICYSLYLVHQLPIKAVSGAMARLGLVSAPATLFVTVPVCLGVAIGLGGLFHHWVERRFLNAPRLPAANPDRVRDLTPLAGGEAV